MCTRNQALRVLRVQFAEVHWIRIMDCPLNDLMLISQCQCILLVYSIDCFREPVCIFMSLLPSQPSFSSTGIE